MIISSNYHHNAVFLSRILGWHGKISSLFDVLNKVLLIIKPKVMMYSLKPARNPVRYALPKAVIWEQKFKSIWRAGRAVECGGLENR
jgi:hypothetical protein